MRDAGDLKEAHARLALLQLADSAFPTGLFAFSHGLETLIQDGAIRSVDSLEAHVRDWVGWVVGPGDAVFVAAAHRSGSVGDLDTLLAVAAHAHALRLPREARDAASRPGGRMASLVALIAGSPDTAAVSLRALAKSAGPIPFPVAFGAAAAALGVPVTDAVLASIQGAASSLLGAALRLMRVDHEQVQLILRRLAPIVIEAAGGALAADWREVMPGHARFDAAQMRHEVAHVRLFMS